MFRFGLEFGSGVRTYITSAAPFVVAISVLLLVNSAWVSMAVGAAFGVGRSLVPIQAALFGTEEWHTRVGAMTRIVEKGGTGVALALVTAAAFGTL